jgi:hypothetical protein
MWFWPANEMIELVPGLPAPQSGDESSECEDQIWFKVQAVPPVFWFDVFPYLRLKTTGLAHCLISAPAELSRY